MITIIWELIQPFIGYIGIGLTALLALWGKGKWDRHKGAKDLKAKQAEATVKAVQKGTEGAAEAVTQLRKGETPQSIKEKNDAAWR